METSYSSRIFFKMRVSKSLVPFILPLSQPQSSSTVRSTNHPPQSLSSTDNTNPLPQSLTSTDSTTHRPQSSSTTGSSTHPPQSSVTTGSTTHLIQSSSVTTSAISSSTTTLRNGTDDLHVISWGGVTSNGLHLANTWIQSLVKSHKIDLGQLNEQSGNVIKTATLLVENRQYADAKLVLLPANPVSIGNHMISSAI